MIFHFSNNRAPAPFWSSDREGEAESMQGIAQKCQQITTPKNRRLHASDPVISRVKRGFTLVTHFQRPYNTQYPYMLYTIAII